MQLCLLRLIPMAPNGSRKVNISLVLLNSTCKSAVRYAIYPSCLQHLTALFALKVNISLVLLTSTSESAVKYAKTNLGVPKESPRDPHGSPRGQKQFIHFPPPDRPPHVRPILLVVAVLVVVLTLVRSSTSCSINITSI